MNNFYHRIVAVIGCVFIALMLLAPLAASAQTNDAMSLTITPPFFDLNVSPGDAWASSIRVVNTNADVLPVHVTLMGFASSDDEGHGTVVDPATLVNDPDALTNWITVSSAPVDVPAGSAVDVPFSINVPRDASPGGHYATILIGTEPGSGQPGSVVGVSSFISALIFVRVAGDIQEAGNIQEFSTDRGYYQSPDVKFTVRFENTGNVHVRPSGEIDIYNAFGKKIGEEDINQTGGLGYVLPSSTRRFDIEWQGDSSIFNIGQYTAVVTLSYGEDSQKNISQTVTFWVFPIGRIAEDLLWIILIVGAFVFILRRIVRKMLAREMSHYGGMPPTAPPPKIYKTENRPSKPSGPPAESGTIDLRNSKRDDGV